MWGDKRFSRDSWTEEKVLLFFNSELGVSPRGMESEYAEFQDLLASGEIAYEYLTIPCCKRPIKPKPINDEWRIFRRAKSGGGDLHGWLKWWSYNWLTAKAGTPAEYEATFKGYGRVDVHSKDLQIFIECGNTSPGHALYALRSNLCSNFIVLPFQRAAFENAAFSSTYKLEAISFFLPQGGDKSPCKGL